MVVVGLAGWGRAVAGQAAAPSAVPSQATVTGAGPRLGVAKIADDLKHWLPGATAVTIYPDNGILVFAFEPTPGQAGTWRGQVSLSPFPAVWQAPPQDLLASLPTEGVRLRVAFPSLPPHGTGWASFQPPAAARPARPERATARPGEGISSGRARTSPGNPGRLGPVTYYVRVLPVVGDSVVGPPSNTVTVKLVPGRDPFLASLAHGMAVEAGQQRAQLVWERSFLRYGLALTGFEPPVFEDPNRWGCIRVIRNPHAHGTLDGFPHPLSGYQEHHEYCPPVDPSTQQKDTWDWILVGLNGWLVAYQGLSDLWNGASGWIATQIVSVLPCEELGATAKGTCQGLATTLVDGALKAGLTATGIPPTIPDLEALGAAARGEVVEAAVGATCATLEEHGGCSPLMEAALSKAYDAGLDQLADQLMVPAQEPQCGQAVEAKDHGVLPLPCFTDYPGTRVEPAPGAVYQPPVVLVRATRLATGPVEAGQCVVNATVLLSNYWPGGQVPGFASPPIPAKPIQGWGFAPAQVPIPPLAVGAAAELRITLPEILLFDLIQGSNYGHGTLLEWYQLYHGSTTTVGAVGFNAPVASPVTGSIAAPRCAEAASFLAKPTP